MRELWRIQSVRLALIAMSLLCSCSKAIKPGSYRVETTDLKNEPTMIARQYVIETSSRRMLCLTSESGIDSTSMAPDGMTKKRTAKVSATSTITMQGLGSDRQIVVEMIVKSGGAIFRFKRGLSVPADADLRSILMESRISGDVTNKTTLLRAMSGAKYLELSIE